MNSLLLDSEAGTVTMSREDFATLLTRLCALWKKPEAEPSAAPQAQDTARISEMFPHSGRLGAGSASTTSSSIRPKRRPHLTTVEDERIRNETFPNGQRLNRKI